MGAETTQVYFTVQEAATYTRRSTATVSEAARAGELRGTQTKARGKWTFRRDDLDRWIEGKAPRADVA